MTVPVCVDPGMGAPSANQQSLPLYRRLWHKFVMGGDYQHSRRKCKSLPPLDEIALRHLALAYVGRYATTCARLSAYLARKLGERGWAMEMPPPVEAIVEQCRSLGYVNDAQFADAKAASLISRGFGARRIRLALRAQGISAPLADDASAVDSEAAYEAALIYARRKRIGPFAAHPPTPELRRKMIASMLRAGHSYEVAQSIVSKEAVDKPAI